METSNIDHQKIKKEIHNTSEIKINDILDHNDLIETSTIISNLSMIQSEYNFRISLLNKRDESNSRKCISDQKKAIQYGPPTFILENKQERGKNISENFNDSKQQINKGLSKNIPNMKKKSRDSGNGHKKHSVHHSSSSSSMQFKEDHSVVLDDSKNKEIKIAIDGTKSNKSFYTASDVSEGFDLQNELYEESQYFSSCSMKDNSSEIENKIKVACLEIPPNEVPKVDSTCIITYYESPSCFYIMVADEVTEQYDLLHENLHKVCKKEDCFKNLSKMKVIENNTGLYFACYFQDNKLDNYLWHRCKVIDLFLDSEEDSTKLKVHFLDEGFESIVDLSDLCTLPSEAYSFPPMAHKCYLAYVYPPGSTNENILDEWPQESIDKCKEILQSEKSFKIASCEMSNKGLRVVLINEVKSYIFVAMVTCNIATLILPDEIEDSKFCFKSEFMKNQIYRAHCFSDGKLDQWSQFDKEIESKKQISEAIEGGYIPRDYARICTFTDKTGKKCFKGNKCRLEHGFLNPDGWTTDKQFVYNKTNEFWTKKGLKLDLIVTHIVNGVTFYACIEPGNKKTIDVISLRQIVKLINDPEKVKTYKLLQFLPSLGELVLAEHDHFLYRARVIDVNDDFVEVFFIDYGNKSRLTMKDLREIHSDMIHLPEQALLFRIVNIAIDEETEIKAEKYLRSEILDSNVSAIVCDEIDNLIEAHIYIKNVDIGQFMISHKLAKHT